MKTKTKHARGTVGYQIAKLVKRYGNYTLGLYILEQALAQALQADSSMRFKPVGALGTPDRLMHEMPRYQELDREEKELFALLSRTVQDSSTTNGQAPSAS